MIFVNFAPVLIILVCLCPYLCVQCEGRNEIMWHQMPKLLSHSLGESPFYIWQKYNMHLKGCESNTGFVDSLWRSDREKSDYV